MQSGSPPDGVRAIHLSSAHFDDDSRIFWKECVSLRQAGYRVTLVISDAEPYIAERQGVKIVAVRRRSGRLARMLTTQFEIVAAGLREKGRIYHFHDPELIPAGLLLQAMGKRVIYDAHEDLPRDILFKTWIPRLLRRPVAGAATALEWLAGHLLSGIVAATPTIARRFPKRATALVQNYARATEFDDEARVPYRERRAVIYVGSVTADRCAAEMVEAMARVGDTPPKSLLIAGPADSAALIDDLKTRPGWPRTEYLGRLDRTGVGRLLAQARVGLVLFRPHQSYVESQPIKLFEYMAAGIPVIAADFPGFRQMVEGRRCGLCVPPCDAGAIAAAIDWMFEHPAEAEEMGRRGREHILSTRNWHSEEQELLRLYAGLLGPNGRGRRAGPLPQ